MACTPSTQVLSPCSDDNVCVSLVLGTGGDVAYSEDGRVNLTAGQTEVSVTFTYEKATADYVFEYLYVSSPDLQPDDIRAVVNDQTTTGFRVELSGAPITANCVLHWHVQVPDSLRVCGPVTSQPHYAIIRPPQQGLTAMVQGQDYVQVTFPIEQADNLWVFEACEIEHLTDPVTTAEVFTWTLSVHETTGFRLELSGTPSDAFYKLRWKVA